MQSLQVDLEALQKMQTALKNERDLALNECQQYK